MRRQLPIAPLEQDYTASTGFPEHVTNITGAPKTLSVLRPQRHTWIQQTPMGPARNESYYLQPAVNKNIFRPTRYWCMVYWSGSPALSLLQLLPPTIRRDLPKWPSHIIPAALHIPKRNTNGWDKLHCGISCHGDPTIAEQGGTTPFASCNSTCKVSGYFQQKKIWHSKGEQHNSPDINATHSAGNHQQLLTCTPSHCTG